jgi:hypothetical protein
MKIYIAAQMLWSCSLALTNILVESSRRSWYRLWHGKARLRSWQARKHVNLAFSAVAVGK